MASERKLVAENLRRVLLREYLMGETKRAGFGGLDIQRTPMGTRVTPEIATCLYTGVLDDTGRFGYTNVTVRTFEIAAAELAACTTRGRWPTRRIVATVSSNTSSWRAV